MAMLSAVIGCLLWAFTSPPVPAQAVGKAHLRRDEMFAYHEIASQFSGSCIPAADIARLMEPVATCPALW